MPTLNTTGRGTQLPAQRSIQRQFMNGRMPLSYMDWGNEGAPLLILIHGSQDHARSWDWTARALCDRWHVVAPDLRGHGDSSWAGDGRYDFPGYISDLAALIDTLGEGPAKIVGHSLGGHLALRFAGICPEKVRTVVVIEAVGAPDGAEDLPTGGTAERFGQWLAKRAAAIGKAHRRFSSVDEAAARLAQRLPQLSPPQIEHLARHGVRRADGAWEWKHDPYLSVWPFPDIAPDGVTALWRAVRCPTLLLYGDKSWDADTANKIMAAVDHAVIRRFANGSHWLQHDCFDEFIEAMRPFLLTGTA